MWAPQLGFIVLWAFLGSRCLQIGGNFSVGAEINGSHHSVLVTIRTSVRVGERELSLPFSRLAQDKIPDLGCFVSVPSVSVTSGGERACTDCQSDFADYGCSVFLLTPRASWAFLECHSDECLKCAILQHPNLDW